MGCVGYAVDSTNDGSGIFFREGMDRILGMPADLPVEAEQELGFFGS